MKKKYFPLLILFIFFSAFKANASHVMGADITYECLGPNQYRVTLTVYRDCDGMALPNGLNLDFDSPCGNGNVPLNRVAVTDITPLCPSIAAGSCGGAGIGVQSNRYQGVLTLPPNQCNNWVLSWSTCCRNGSINTGASSDPFYVSSRLDNTLNPNCNSSPVFNNAPSVYTCINQPFVYNHGVSDVDGDSLFFSLGNCYQGAGAQANYNGGFSGANPLNTASGVTVNSATGAISFTPTVVQVAILCVLAEEYRNGVKIGEVNRDLQFVVQNCNNTSPEATGIDSSDNNVITNFNTSICANSPLCFSIDGSDPNLDNVNMSWNNEIPGGVFTVTNNGSANPEAEFCWTPSVSDIGLNVFTVNLVDDHCPVIGSSTFTYVIEVLPSPNTLNVSPNAEICEGDNTVLTASSTPTATGYVWSPSTGLSATTGNSVTANPSVTTIYTVSASFPDGCDLVESVTVTVNPLPNVAIDPANSFNCAGQLTVLNALAPTAVTASWNTSSSIVDTAHIYANATSSHTLTVTDANGCQNSETAVINIAQPVGNVCNVLYVTPGGSGSQGSKTNPMALQDAMVMGACIGTTIKMAQGTYPTDSAINRVSSYLTLEGGYDAVTWEKVSTIGATRILRTATMSTSLLTGSNSILYGTGIPDEAGPSPKVVAMDVRNQTGFRFQDITIETEGFAGQDAIEFYQGVSTYGVELISCTDYDIVRTNIEVGAASGGYDRVWSQPATNGGSSYGISAVPNGANGRIINSNISAGTRGFGGVGPPNGTNGVSTDVRRTGSAFVSQDDNFNLAAQPTITAADIACTNTLMDYSATSAATWGFGLGSTPTAPAGSAVITQYSTIGRRDVAFGANNYAGFTNILLDDAQIPTISTNAPFVDGAYRICAGTAINFNANEGGVGYIYHWDLGGGAIPNSYDGSQYEYLSDITFNTPGVYTIEIRYETNCCGTGLPGTIDIFVEEVPVISPIADVNLCEGVFAPAILNAGTLPTNGSISWATSTGLDRTDSVVVFAQPADSMVYSITMTDSTGLCVTTDEVAVNMIDLELTPNTTDQGCLPDGSINSIQVLGGTGNYSYTFNGTPNTPMPVTDLQSGTYYVTVTDVNNSCEDSLSIYISPGPAAVTGWINNTQNVSCAGSADGFLTVEGFGGVPPYTYAWSSGSTTNTTGLQGGGYDTVVITDNTGICYTTVTGYIYEPDSLNIAIASIDSASCPTSNDGEIAVVVDLGMSPYQYSWNTGNPGDTFAILSNQVAGEYCLTVIDAGNCVSMICDTIFSPPIVLADTIINICQGDSQFLGGAWQSTSGIYEDTISVTSVGGTQLDTVFYDTFNGVNNWTFTNGNGPTNNNGPNSNVWTIGAGENGVAPPMCSPSPANLSGDQTLHITNTLFGVNNGAYYIESGGPSSVAFDTDKDATSINISTMGLTGVELNFDFIGNGDALFDNASVHYSNDGGANWYVVDNSLKSPLCGTQGQWTFANYALPSSAENIPNLKVRFNWVNDDDNVGVPTDPSIAINNLYVTGEISATSYACDTLLTTQLIVNPTYSEPTVYATICQDDSYVIPSGGSVNIEGTYIDTFMTISGCDSILTTELRVDSFQTLITSDTICEGETLIVNGVSYNSPGQYFDTAHYAVSGCDSLRFDITLHVDSVHPAISSDTICEGETLIVNGVSYAGPGHYFDTARYTLSGCDSLHFDITLHVDSVHPVIIVDTICEGASITVNGVSYSGTGHYFDTARYTLSGCDSLHFDINLRVDSLNSIVRSDTICEGETLTINGVGYTGPGHYFDTARYAISGCDSLHFDITIQVDSLNIINVDTVICQAMNIIVNGQSYDSTGMYFDTLRYANSGCDSVQFVINLLVNPTFNDTIYPSICANEFYTLPDASVVNTAGTYHYPDTTINGCDSLYTVVLTVDTLPVSMRYQSICFNDSIFLANDWQRTNGVYIDTFAVAGTDCDSIRITTLTINALPVVVASANFTSLCQGETLILTGSGANTYSWSNMVNDNVGFVQAVGTVSYLVTGTDNNFCVDTASISVNVNPTYAWSETVTICEDALPYTFHDGSTYNSFIDVTHVNNLTSSSIPACDSIITTNLVVNRVGVFATIPDTIKQCDNFYIEIDMAAQNMSSYQWQLDDGTGFINLTNSGIYSGTDSNQLVISPLDVSLDGNSYRIVMFDECGYGPYMDTTSLIVNEPHDLANPIDDVVRCLRDSSLIYVDYNGYDYVWSNGQTGPYLVVDGSGTYAVTFTENGTDCAMEDDFDVEINDCVENCVVLAPTGFSPNQSSVNDVFRVMTSCDEGFSFFEFMVFNRWGEMVYETDNPNDGWDGTYRGSKAEIGVYVYSVDFTKNGKSEKEKLTGQVTLIR